MIKLILAVTLTIVLTGCNLEGWEIRRAQEICAERGGIKVIWSSKGKFATCNDGLEFKINKKKEANK